LVDAGDNSQTGAEEPAAEEPAAEEPAAEEPAAEEPAAGGKSKFIKKNRRV